MEKTQRDKFTTMAFYHNHILPRPQPSTTPSIRREAMRLTGIHTHTPHTPAGPGVKTGMENPNIDTDGAAASVCEDW